MTDSASTDAAAILREGRGKGYVTEAEVLEHVPDAEAHLDRLAGIQEALSSHGTDAQPTPPEAAELPIERVRELLSYLPRPVSLDAPMGDASESALGEVLPSGEPDPEEQASGEVLKAEVQQVLDRALTERERLVLQMRFGLGNGHVYPLDPLVERLGVLRERARQLEKLRRSHAADRLAAYSSRGE